MKLEWRRVEPTTVQMVGDYRTMVRKNFILPSGELREFVIKDEENSTAQSIIAITPDNKIVLAKQYRPVPEKVMYELPGGGREGSETPERAVVRELKEETGCNVGSVEHLGHIYKDAYTNTKRSYFIGYDCTPSGEGQQLDEAEFIDPVLVTADELFDLARNQSMTDTEALFLAYEKLKGIAKE